MLPNGSGRFYCHYTGMENKCILSPLALSHRAIPQEHLGASGTRKVHHRGNGPSHIGARMPLSSPATFRGSCGLQQSSRSPCTPCMLCPTPLVYAGSYQWVCSSRCVILRMGINSACRIAAVAGCRDDLSDLCQRFRQTYHVASSFCFPLLVKHEPMAHSCVSSIRQCGGEGSGDERGPRDPLVNPCCTFLLAAPWNSPLRTPTRPLSRQTRRPTSQRASR